MTFVPAVMQLLIDRAWAMPAWLDRVLPSFDVEGERLGDVFGEGAERVDSTRLRLTAWPSADTYGGLGTSSARRRGSPWGPRPPPALR